MFGFKPAEVEVAKTTQYQNNGGLNALVHVLYENMDGPGSIVGTAGVGAVGNPGTLLEEFKQEHGFEIGTTAQLKALLKDLSPVQREIVLGPVLRRMVQAPKHAKVAGAWAELTAQDVRHVANQFEIKVEWYSTDEGTRAEIESKIRADEYLRYDNGVGPGRGFDVANSLSDPIAAAVLRQYPGIDPASVAARNKEFQLRLNRIIQDLVAQKMHEHEEQKRLHHKPGVDMLADNRALGYVDQTAHRRATLSLRSEGNQWGRVVATSDIADAHNAVYKVRRKPYDYDVDHAGVVALMLDAKIEYDAAVTAGKPNPKVDAAAHFAKSEEKSGKAASPEQHMQMMVENIIGGITNMFPGGGKGSFLDMIGQFLAKLLGGIFGMVPMLKQMGKQLNQGKRTAGSEIDADEIAEATEKDPELGLAYERFSDLTAALNNPALNKAWRAHPNSPTVWRQGFRALVDADQFDEADEWIKREEGKLLQDLQALESKNPTGGRCAALITNYRAVLAQLENPVLAYSKPEEKARNLMERFEMYQLTLSKMQAVMVAQDQDEKLTTALDREDTELRALRALPGAHSQTLTDRITAIQAAYNQKDAERTAARRVTADKDVTAGTLEGGGPGTLDGMFNAYNLELTRVTAAAGREKARLEKEQKDREAFEMKLALAKAKAKGK